MAFSLTDNFLPENTFELNPSSTRPGFTFKPDPVEMPDIDFDSLQLDLKPNTMAVYATDTEDPITNILADFMGTSKAKAQKSMFEGAVLKTVGSAAQAFDAIINFGRRQDSINLQADNTKIAADNKMKAIDNQVLYTKNQIMDRFNTMVANNTVALAAKNIRVTAGTLLESTKGEAYDINQDFATLDSNARMKKLELQAQKDNAEVARSLAKSQQWSNLVGSLAKLGLSVGTGGGTGESWGDLYAGYKQANAWLSGSLNDLY